MALLKTPLLSDTKAPRPFGKEEMEDITPWSPYPLMQTSVPAQVHYLFNHTTTLVTIMNDILNLLYSHHDKPINSALWGTACSLHEKLLAWHRALPSSLSATDQAPAHILGLQ